MRTWPDLSSETIDSIYLGGGTPSLLSASELHSILELIEKQFSMATDAEITLEANPDDIIEQTLFDWKSAGINRLSVGIQSFYDDELRWMNRAHSVDEALTAVSKCQDAGYNNLSVDLIFGTPFSTMKRWEDTLLRFEKFQVPHLSAYGLTVEEKTALAHQIQKGESPAVDEAMASEQFLFLMNWSENAGYDHYEISNYAREGHRAVHNSNYWKGVSYIGLGPGAHSYADNQRGWNVAHNSQYIKGIQSGQSVLEIEKLSEKDQYNEYVMTALRTKEGIDQRVLEGFSFHLKESFSAIGESFIKEKKMEMRDGRIQLSREGKLFADRIASEFFID